MPYLQQMSIPWTPTPRNFLKQQPSDTDPTFSYLNLIFYHLALFFVAELILYFFARKNITSNHCENIMVSADQVSPIHRGPTPAQLHRHHFHNLHDNHLPWSPSLHRGDLCHPAVLMRPVMELIWLLLSPQDRDSPLLFPVIPPLRGVKATRSEEVPLVQPIKPTLSSWIQRARWPSASQQRNRLDLRLC